MEKKMIIFNFLFQFILSPLPLLFVAYLDHRRRSRPRRRRHDGNYARFLELSSSFAERDSDGDEHESEHCVPVPISINKARNE
jgi:hypothetical protein